MDSIESRNEYLPYRVIAQQTLSDLEIQVEIWMSRGYRPTGGITTFDVQTSVWYMQAVVFEGEG